MNKSLRVLFIEDSEDDTALMVRELRRSGYEPIYERVENAEAMQTALARQTWDIVISDYSMPHFDALAALALLQASGLDLPFIIISGTIGEERAVAIMKAGAHDYLMKDRLARLTPVIVRELREVEVRRERRQAEEALWQSEERFATVFRASPVALSITRLADGRFIDVNESFLDLFGYSRAELIGRRSTDLNMFSNPDEWADLEKRLREQETVRNYEITALAKSGEAHSVLLSTEAIELDGGPHTLATLIDISERKQARALLDERAAALERSNRELEQFAYVASHDLQEPLRMVSSYLQLLARRYQGQLDADADEFIAYAVDGANRMKKLINDLLAFSRVDTRGSPFEPTDCEAILERVLNTLKPAIEEHEAVVTFDPLPTVVADGIQLERLFQNLLTNALTYRRDQPPQIHVGAEHKAADDEWLFSVRDNGIGLDMQYAERIFVIFQRLHSNNDYSAGTGIGLAICKKIVERHGGRIWVEAEPGQGSFFYFTLPAVAVDSNQ
jgi:PAS domain S-box-containing protein